jgi:predicted nucleic acid-binding protein
MAASEAEALLDTSFVVRYLTDDPPAMAARAAEVVDSDRILAVSTVVLAEVWYVLRDRYQVPREAALDALLGLVGRANIRVLNLSKDVVVSALELCRPSGRVSLADALIWAQARQAGIPVVYTFDQRFPTLDLDVRAG